MATPARARVTSETRTIPTRRSWWRSSRTEEGADAMRDDPDRHGRRGAPPEADAAPGVDQAQRADEVVEEIDPMRRNRCRATWSPSTGLTAQVPRDEWLAALRGPPAARSRRSPSCTRCCCARRASSCGRRRRRTTSDDLAHGGGRRRADGACSASSTLPRRQPLHDLGLQVRAARGGREGAPPRLARPRGAARRGALARVTDAGLSAHERARAATSCCAPCATRWAPS